MCRFAVLALACSTLACAAAPGAPGPPLPSGCIIDVSPGLHTFTCEGLAVDVSVPDACERPAAAS